MLLLATPDRDLVAQEKAGPGGSPSMLQYLGERASRLAAQGPALPSDLPFWEQRRATVREHLREVLGLPAAREPMRARVLSTTRDGELAIEEVMYLWAERAYVSANVVRPAAVSGPLPALVMPPGWLGQLTQEYYRTFVYHKAREGYLVLFIDDPHVGKRAAPYAGLYGAASAAGTQVMGIQVFDTLRGLDYLLTRPDVDPGRIGVAGLCQGSEQTWLAAALEDRFQIAVPVCGTTTYEGWARMPAFLHVDLSDPSPYVENVLRYTDWHEINACIAPRPVFIASNSGDNWWPKEGYDKVVRTLTHMFQLYGKPERFKHLLDLRSHSLTPFIPELAPWIDRQLKALPASASAERPPAARPSTRTFPCCITCNAVSRVRQTITRTSSPPKPRGRLIAAKSGSGCAPLAPSIVSTQARADGPPRPSPTRSWSRNWSCRWMEISLARPCSITARTARPEAARRWSSRTIRTNG